MKFYSHGKLLITGEYVVLDGAKSLALPTKKGQSFRVEKSEGKQLIWESFNVEQALWFRGVFSLKKIKIKETTDPKVAKQLQVFLRYIKLVNPEFLKAKEEVKVSSFLEFPQDWGLGSSSTLIHFLGQWGKVDPYELLFNAFKGSGYDIACAGSNQALIYQLKKNKPSFKAVEFNPIFKDKIYFVHLNTKQNSRKGIEKYRENTKDLSSEISQIKEIGKQLLEVDKLEDFEDLLTLHEEIISNIIGIEPVKERLFPDYPGLVKSLGAWGGDFVLVSDHGNMKDYFNQKGYSTILSYEDMIL